MLAASLLQGRAGGLRRNGSFLPSPPPAAVSSFFLLSSPRCGFFLLPSSQPPPYDRVGVPSDSLIVEQQHYSTVAPTSPHTPSQYHHHHHHPPPRRQLPMHGARRFPAISIVLLGSSGQESNFHLDVGHCFLAPPIYTVFWARGHIPKHVFYSCNR